MFVHDCNMLIVVLIVALLFMLCARARLAMTLNRFLTWIYNLFSSGNMLTYSYNCCQDTTILLSVDWAKQQQQYDGSKEYDSSHLIYIHVLQINIFLIRFLLFGFDLLKRSFTTTICSIRFLLILAFHIFIHSQPHSRNSFFHHLSGICEEITHLISLFRMWITFPLVIITCVFHLSFNTPFNQRDSSCQLI